MTGTLITWTHTPAFPVLCAQASLGPAVPEQQVFKGHATLFPGVAHTEFSTVLWTGGKVYLYNQYTPTDSFSKPLLSTCYEQGLVPSTEGRRRG